MPESARRVVEKAIQINKPPSFACGILVTSINVVSVFTDP
jgi:hypothetical protein